MSSQPVKYEKTTTFANLNATQAFPKIDAELNNVATSINQIRNRLELIQKDDGGLKLTSNLETAIEVKSKAVVDNYTDSTTESVKTANLTSKSANDTSIQALEIAELAKQQSLTALDKATTSEQTVANTVTSINATQASVQTVITNLPSNIESKVTEKTANIPNLIQQTVDEAVVEKAGVTEQTITTALGYKPANKSFVDVIDGKVTTIEGQVAEIDGQIESLEIQVGTIEGSLAPIATSGQFSDLYNVPSEFTPSEHSHTKSQISDFPELATVATSGSYTDLLNTPTMTAVPSGVIAMWSGSSDAIPSGWYLCNGENNTPDLRDRFLVGAGSSYTVGDTGGNDTVNIAIANLPSHRHTGTTDAGTAHSHGVSNPTVPYPTDHKGNPDGGADTGDGTTLKQSYWRGYKTRNVSTNSESAHKHNFTTSYVGGNEALDIRPKYFALCFIMKG